MGNKLRNPVNILELFKGLLRLRINQKMQKNVTKVNSIPIQKLVKF